MRRAARVNANLDEIARAYEKLGCVVHRTNGAWDLTVQYPVGLGRAVETFRGSSVITDLVEVKDSEKPPSRRRLTPAEKKTHAKMGIWIITNLDEVEWHVKVLRARA